MSKYSCIVLPRKGTHHYEVARPFVICEDDILDTDKYAYWKAKLGKQKD